MNRPRPVLTANSIAGAVKAVVLILGFLGLDQAKDIVDTNTAVIVSIALGVLALGGDILAALHAQSQVTPKAKPQADDGMPLIRADHAVLPQQQYFINNFPGKHEAADVQPAALDVPDADEILAAADEILAAADEIHPSA